MKWLPFENFYILTDAQPDQVQELITAEIAPKTGFNFSDLFRRSSAYYFQGEAGYREFRVSRIIFYRNSFLPRISGVIEPYLQGSRVHVKMRMRIFVSIFMCIWLGVVACVSVMLLVKEITDRAIDFWLLLPFVMFGFGYGLTMWGFKSESRKATDKLITMLNGRIEE